MAGRLSSTGGCVLGDAEIPKGGFAMLPLVALSDWTHKGKVPPGAGSCDPEGDAPASDGEFHEKIPVRPPADVNQWPSQDADEAVAAKALASVVVGVDVQLRNKFQVVPRPDGAGDSDQETDEGSHASKGKSSDSGEDDDGEGEPDKGADRRADAGEALLKRTGRCAGPGVPVSLVSLPHLLSAPQFAFTWGTVGFGHEVHLVWFLAVAMMILVVIFILGFGLK